MHDASFRDVTWRNGPTGGPCMKTFFVLLALAALIPAASASATKESGVALKCNQPLGPLRLPAPIVAAVNVDPTGVSARMAVPGGQIAGVGWTIAPNPDRAPRAPAIYLLD